MGKPLICKYCGDVITAFQKETMKDGMHEGCVELKKAMKSNDRLIPGYLGGQHANWER